MPTVTLDAPMAVNPETSTKLDVRHATLDFENQKVTIDALIKDGNGAVIGTRTVQLLASDDPAVGTWLGAREDQIVTYLLNKLGVTGTKD